jgi:hypothetical protein
MNTCHKVVGGGTRTVGGCEPGSKNSHLQACQLNCDVLVVLFHLLAVVEHFAGLVRGDTHSALLGDLELQCGCVGTMLGRNCSANLLGE